MLMGQHRWCGERMHVSVFFPCYQEIADFDFLTDLQREFYRETVDD
jgi:hypothetical protein